MKRDFFPVILLPTLDCISIGPAFKIDIQAIFQIRSFLWRILSAELSGSWKSCVFLRIFHWSHAAAALELPSNFLSVNNDILVLIFAELSRSFQLVMVFLCPRNQNLKSTLRRPLAMARSCRN